MASGIAGARSAHSQPAHCNQQTAHNAHRLLSALVGPVLRQQQYHNTLTGLEQARARTFFLRRRLNLAEHGQWLGLTRLGMDELQAKEPPPQCQLWRPRAAPSTILWTSHPSSRQDSCGWVLNQRRLHSGRGRIHRNTITPEAIRPGRLLRTFHSGACELRHRCLRPSRGLRFVAALRCMWPWTLTFASALQSSRRTAPTSSAPPSRTTAALLTTDDSRLACRKAELGGVSIRSLDRSGAQAAAHWAICHCDASVLKLRCHRGGPTRHHNTTNTENARVTTHATHTRQTTSHMQHTQDRPHHTRNTHETDHTKH